MATVARLGHYRRQVKEKGLGAIIGGRLRWYKQSFQMDNWIVGRLVELFGNKVSLDGARLSLDNPLIQTRHKSTIFFGIYEVEERALAKRWLDPNIGLVEIGGSIGGVACITNKMLSDPTKHVVVECNQFVLPTLEKNRTLNKCAFAIEAKALAYGADTISFAVDTGHFMKGHLGSGENLQQVTVPTVSLAEIIKTHGLGTINLISDSEGAEIDMIENEGTLMRDHVKMVILETHPHFRGQAAITDMLKKLGQLGFETVHADTRRNAYAFVNRRLA